MTHLIHLVATKSVGGPCPSCGRELYGQAHLLYDDGLNCELACPACCSRCRVRHLEGPVRPAATGKQEEMFR